MTAEKQSVDDNDWNDWVFEATSQLCYYFGITPHQEQQILTDFERMVGDIESGQSFISKEGFIDIIDAIINEADSKTFQ